MQTHTYKQRDTRASAWLSCFFSIKIVVSCIYRCQCQWILPSKSFQPFVVVIISTPKRFAAQFFVCFPHRVPRTLALPPKTITFIFFFLCKAHFASKLLCGSWLLCLFMNVCVYRHFIGLSSAMPRIPIIISFIVYYTHIFCVQCTTHSSVHNWM